MILVVVSPHRWPFAVGGLVVALALWAIGRALVGAAHPIAGAVASASLVFIALVPVVCSGSDHPARRSCTGLLPVSFPGYSGTGADFEPSLVPALSIAVVTGVACYAAAMRAHRAPPSRNSMS